MRSAQAKFKTLLIVTNVPHEYRNGIVMAYGPFVREIDIWADLFSEIRIAAPNHLGPSQGDNIPYSRANIVHVPIPFHSQGGGISHRLAAILQIPKTIVQLIPEIRRSNGVHVRCPGSLGLVGAILAPLFFKKVIAKYAGTWPDYRGEPFSYRFQKSVLKSFWFRGPITVYGNWPNQPKHVKPFFTSILDANQVDKAKEVSPNKQLHSPARILFIGRMDRGKNTHVLLSAIAILNERGYKTEVTIVGHGTEMENLLRQSQSLNLTNQVTFTGAVPFSQVINYYEWGDILVLTSENSEGWPKAIAEGMTFGLVCFGSERGLIPQMLADGRGIITHPVTPQQLAIEMEKLLASPALFREISQSASDWAQQYSLEGLREALRELFIQEWHLTPEELHQSIEGTCRSE